MSVYLLKLSQRTKDLLAYFRKIHDFKAANINWQYYDHQFRKDRAITRRVWNEIRFDMYAQIITRNFPFYEEPGKTSQQSSRPSQKAGVRSQSVPPG